MIDDIHRRVGEALFRPFTIVTSAGTRYRVPSRDHIGFGPRGSRVLVWFDDDTSALVAALHIVAIEEDESSNPVVRPRPSA